MKKYIQTYPFFIYL